MEIKNFIKGAQIIANKVESYPFLSAEHDIIYLPPCDNLTEEDIKSAKHRYVFGNIGKS